jgi:hypothetical protein
MSVFNELKFDKFSFPFRLLFHIAVHVIHYLSIE